MHRRTFLKSSALVALAGTSAFQSPQKIRSLRLAFSTLGCPGWTFEEILNFAARHGFESIEIRGLLKEMDLVKCPEFSTADAIRETNEKLKKAGISVIDLGASAAFHMPNGPEREQAFQEARRFINLASALHCPYIRVFPNSMPKNQDKDQTLELIRAALQELGRYAAPKKVRVLMETHGDLVYKADLLKLMEPIRKENVGLVWDVVNMWSVTKEPVADAYAAIKPFIYHTHIKDYREENGQMRYTMLGQGTSPILDAVALLKKDRYKGVYSFEWEKRWHPEIEAPELAIADYAEVMRKRFG